jgi:hypothetical protein
VKVYGTTKYVDLPYYAKILSFDSWTNIYRCESWVEAEKDGQKVNQHQKLIVVGEFWDVNWVRL